MKFIFHEDAEKEFNEAIICFIWGKTMLKIFFVLLKLTLKSKKSEIK
jgi:hypothetical protein